MNKLFRFSIPIVSALLALVILFFLVGKEAYVNAQKITLPQEEIKNSQETTSDGDFRKVPVHSRLQLESQADQSFMVVPPMYESEGGWEIQCFGDCLKHDAEMTDRNIAMDSNGHLHIAYGGNQLFYGWYDGVNWNMQGIDDTPGSGGFASLGLDNSDFPHIAYNSPSGLRYAYKDGSGWHTEVVDSLGGGVPSLIMSDSNDPHIAYVKSGLIYYAYQDQYGWHFEMASDISGYNNSLALDGNGNPHISFIAEGWRYDYLRYTFKDDTGWHTEVVDGPNRAGKYTSIAVDTNGYPHIAYSFGWINYAYKDSSGWHIESVVGGGGQFGSPSLVLDVQNHPHLAIKNDGWEVWGGGTYTYKDDTDWHAQIIAEDFKGYPSITLDEAGIPNIIYTNLKSNIIYSKPEGNDWQFTTIDSGLLIGEYSSIAISSDLLLHASAYDDFYKDLRFIYQEGGETQSLIIDAEGIIGKYNSMVLNNYGYAHISYYDQTNGDLKYAFQDANGWNTQTLDSDGDVGLFTSLKLDSLGYPHISYYDQTYGYLKYAFQDVSGWHIQVIDSVGDVGQYSSIALDSVGNPHFSYYDATNSALKYDGQIIDDPGNVGKYSSLSLDFSNHPHISYYDESLGDLKYIFRDDFGWHTEIVDSLGDVGQYSSIVLQGNANPYISYYSMSMGDLKFAFHSSSGWEIRTIDYQGDVGSHSVIQVDEEGKPWIGYYDADNLDLEYARYRFDTPPVDWTIKVVDSEISVGSHTSIALDNYNNATISYYDELTPSLKYAEYNGSSWDIQVVDQIGQKTSLVYDSNNYAHIAYDSDNIFWGGVVKYANENQTGWYTQTVGSGFGVSLALDHSGSPHLSYSDINTGLYYAFMNENNWSVETIDPSLHLGNTSIAIDPLGDPHIAYIQLTCYWTCLPIGLNYAFRDDAGWNLMNLYTDYDYDYDSGEYNSLVLDQDGYPHISSQVNGHLIYIHQDITGWYSETVDTSPDVGDFSSIVLNAAGEPYISYYDATNGDLKLAYQDSSGWQILTIDSALDVGKYSSIALDNYGLPHISYYNTTNGDLKFAYLPSSSILVTTLEDELNGDGDCSLREAIEAANTNEDVDECPAGDAVITDTITFDVAGTITVTSQLSVTAGGPLVIDGGEVITTSGGGTTRVWWVEAGSVLTLQNLSVTDGYIEGSGAGLYNNAASVTIVQSQFKGNRLLGDIFFGGAIYNFEGTLVVYDSLFKRNGNEYPSGRVFGGGIAFQGGTGEIIHSTFQNNIAVGECDMYYIPGGGGIWIDSASVSIQESEFINNQEPCGGGGIANLNGSTLTVSNSTFSDNSSDYGGGIYNESTLSIINCTFSGNHTINPGLYWGEGGGIYHWDGILTITNSILSGNSASGAGGIFFSNGTVTAINTIISNNQSRGDCSSMITDGGHNISSDDTCGFDPANGSMPNTDPLLGPLQDNDGPTWTHALLPGSPAIDAGDDAQCPPTDQRGVIRPQDGDGDGVSICDIGSYELEGPWVSPTMVTITAPSEAPPGPVINFTATVEPISTTLPITYIWNASGHPPITETRGLTDTVGWAWEVPGTYAITVTASNPAGSVIDTHLITISSPIGQTYLPLIIKASDGMLAPAQPASLPGDGAVMWLEVPNSLNDSIAMTGKLTLEYIASKDFFYII